MSNKLNVMKIIVLFSAWSLSVEGKLWIFFFLFLELYDLASPLEFKGTQSKLENHC